MENDRRKLADCLRSFSSEAINGKLRAIFAVGIADDGPLPVVYVEPEDRESLIIAINEELSRMFGVPHHVVSTGKLQAFLIRNNITDYDLVDFEASYEE